MSKWYKKFIPLLLLLLLLAPTSAQAAESVTVEIPFTVSGAPSTVIIVPLGQSPAPETDRFENAIQGSFQITFSEDGLYYYEVQQEPGASDVEYSKLVYKVLVTVTTDEDGVISAIVAIWLPDNPNKVGDIFFDNPPGVRIDKLQKLNNGTRTKELLYSYPGDRITYYVTVINGTDEAVYDLVLTDMIPEGLILVEDNISDEGYADDDNVITWELGTIAAQSSRTVWFTTVVPNVDKETWWINEAEGSYVTSPAVQAQTLSARVTPLAGENGGRVLLRTNDVEAVYDPTLPSPTAVPTATPNKSDVPKTGDMNAPGLWLAVLTVCALGLGAVALGRRRRG